MKKIVISALMVAATNCAFAQLKVTGSLSMGYKATTMGNAAGTQSSGFGVDTSVINLSDQEDLGHGQKVVAKMSIQGADRSGANDTGVGNGTAVGGDASLTYSSNGFGQIELGTARGAADLSGLPSAGAPVIDMDEKIFGMRLVRDYLSFTAPIGSMSVQVKYVEPKNAAVGIGVGSTGSVRQHDILVSAIYFQGPAKFIGTYVSYDNRNALPVAATKDNAYSLQGSYDFGVANVGAGYVMTNATNGAHVMYAMFGVNVPIGSWNVGATFGQSNVMDAPVSSDNLGLGPWDMSKYNGNASSLSFGVSYALSKRTSITGKYATWTPSGFRQYEADNGANGRSGLGYSFNANEFSLLLSHSF